MNNNMGPFYSFMLGAAAVALVVNFFRNGGGR
jgi:hypothetical protein